MARWQLQYEVTLWKHEKLCAHRSGEGKAVVLLKRRDTLLLYKHLDPPDMFRRPFGGKMIHLKYMSFELKIREWRQSFDQLHLMCASLTFSTEQFHLSALYQEFTVFQIPLCISAREVANISDLLSHKKHTSIYEPTISHKTVFKAMSFRRTLRSSFQYTMKTSP